MARQLVITITDTNSNKQEHRAFDEDKGASKEEILFAVEELRQAVPSLPDNVISFVHSDN